MDDKTTKKLTNRGLTVKTGTQAGVLPGDGTLDHTSPPMQTVELLKGGKSVALGVGRDEDEALGDAVAGILGTERVTIERVDAAGKVVASGTGATAAEAKLSLNRDALARL